MGYLRKFAAPLAVAAITMAAFAFGGAGEARATVGSPVFQVPGQYATIQAAVDAAAETNGARIIVQPGTYPESVMITTNNISLQGIPGRPWPVITPPAQEDTGCNSDVGGELDGICVFPLDNGPISNIEISYLTVQNFPATGIFAFNSVNLSIHDTLTRNNAEYGIARFDSSRTMIYNNTSTGSGEAGIYVGDSPNAQAIVRNNTVMDNGFGIFVRDASHGMVTNNKVSGNCLGIFVLETGEPTQNSDWTISRNTVNRNNKDCPPSDEAPPISGGGIVILGASNIRVNTNYLVSNRPGGPTPFSGGVVVASSVCFGGSDPSRVFVNGNKFSGNLPDIAYDGTGSQVVFSQNGSAEPAPVPPIPCV